MNRTPTIAALLLALLTVGCSVERGESTFEAQTFPDAAAHPDLGPTESDLGPGEGPGAGTMSGTWLLEHEASTCVVIDEQITWGHYLIDIEQNGRILTETRRECALELSAVFGLETVASSETIASLRFIDVDNGMVSSVKPGGTYSSSTELGLWGVDLDNPLTDEVPSDPEDPAVIDADNDGNPGITFGVVGSDCERYVAHRQVIRYRGTLVQPNDVEGTSTTVTDSVVVGSSEPLCGVDPVITPNDQLSRFRMVRIDGLGGAIDVDADGDGTVSCDEAAPLFDTLFERRTPSAENCRR